MLGDTAHHRELVNNRLKVLRKIKFVAWRKKRKIHILRESLQAVEDAETSSTVEGCYVEKATIVETSKNNLLIYFKSGIPFLLLSCQVVD